MQSHSQERRNGRTMDLLLFFVFVSGFQFMKCQPIWTSPTIVSNQTHGFVDSKSPVAFRYSGLLGAVRVTVGSLEATEESPILVIIKRQRSVMSWQIPIVLEEAFSYTFASRTLCPTIQHPHNGVSSTFTPETGEEFFIEIITLSVKRISFSLIVETFPGFHVQQKPWFELKASPSEPQYVHYKMRDDVNRVLVKLRATQGNEICSFLSIQSVRCPVGDLDSDLRLDGRYQSVTSKGAIEVSRRDFPDGQFYIVLLVKPSDEECEETTSLFNLLQRRVAHKSLTYLASRYKTVNITIIESLGSNSYVVATVVPIAIFVVFALLSICLLQTGFRTWRAIICKDLDRIALPSADRQWGISLLFEKSVTGKTIPSLWESDNYNQLRHVGMVKHPETASNSNLELLNKPGEGEQPDPHCIHVNLTSLDLTKNVKRPGAGTLHRIADMNHKSSQEIKQTVREYGCSLMTVFVFYSLPVLQLVMTHQGLLHVTGNEDICYYNFSCANTVGILSDFNHIISNIGYIILGILFIVMVRRRSIYTAKLRRVVPNLDDYGIPSQLGLFYGMGLALTMEGVMSACYHVCPSYNNFQFDTSFMYLISGLLILKLYHARHPDFLPSSYAAYALFAGFIFIAVVGVVSKDIIYWIVFSVIHGLITIFCYLQILFVGYLKFSFAVLKEGIQTAFSKKKGTRLKIPFNRIVLSTLIGLINLMFAVVGPLFRPFDFASNLLFILQANLIVYSAFYIGMKVMDTDERISRATCLYFLLATPAWLIGMYYFMQGLTNWEHSAAISREGNRDCFFFNFYDEHDVWHMCSAVGLFFTFMMLLTLDDDLATVPRDKISVF